MKALNDFIIINKVIEEHKTSGGLLLTAEDTKELRYQRGTVISFGPLVKSAKEGTDIYYDKVNAFDVRMDGELFTMIRERDLIAVCE